MIEWYDSLDPVERDAVERRNLDRELAESGAESLAGKGDGLLKSPQYNGIVRFQSFYKV